MQACGLVDGSRSGMNKSEHVNNTAHLFICAREGAASDGRGTRNQGHSAREIRDAAEGVQDNADGDGAREAPGDD